MERLGKNIIAESKFPPFFKLSNSNEAATSSPINRKGEALRTWVRSLSGFQKEALVKSTLTGSTWRLVSDEGPYLNGHDAAPCPLAFLSTGMVASFMNEILALSQERGVKVSALRLILDNFYTMKGSMLKRTMVGGAENVELKVEIACDMNDRSLYDFLVDATYASPLNGLMRGEHESLFKLAKNGVELPTNNVLELSGPIFPDPSDSFDKSLPKENKLDLMKPIGLTPVKEVRKGTSSGGSSLSDEQDRRLNIGAIAILREDGIKEIQQMQYSPHGTSFRFLSSEDGRAPDASTLISAGIGFCFMTQFGRFVSMLNLDLPDYKIVQDSHFSLGGASGKTGKPGSADPIETHVYLNTSESDNIAKEMLDISEKTCFLHSFCRTNLKIKLKVVRL